MIGGEHVAAGFREYHGLSLRPAGYLFATGFEVLHPLACTAIGISYLAARGQESVVVREIVPEIDVSDFSAAHRLSRSLLTSQIKIGAGLLCRPFVRGQSLEQHLLVEGAMSVDTARAHVVRLVQDLRDLHGAGMIHGSVHAGNIILSEEREGILVDAVVPASLRQRAIRVLRGEIYDDRTHLAPELLRGRPLRPAADWYALGSLIWLALTGLPRYHVGETNSKKVAGAPPDAPLSCPREQAWFRRLIEALLEPDPEQRLTDAALILEALDREQFRAPRKRIAVPGNARDISPDVPAAGTAPGLDSGRRSRYRPGTGARWGIAVLGTLCSLLAGFLILAEVRIAELEADLDRLRDDLTFLETRSHTEPEELGKTGQRFDARAADAESSASELQRELAAHRTLNHELENKNRELENRLEARTNELKALQNQSAALVESAVNRSEADRDRTNTLKQSLDNSKVQLATERSESAEFERQHEAAIRSRDNEIKRIKGQLHNMRTEQNELQRKHEGAISMKNEKIGRLQGDKQELRDELDRRDEVHADALKEKEETIKELQQRLKELEKVKKKAVIDRLEERVKKLQEDNDRLKEENRKLKEKLQASENGGSSPE